MFCDVAGTNTQMSMSSAARSLLFFIVTMISWSFSWSWSQRVQRCSGFCLNLFQAFYEIITHLCTSLQLLKMALWGSARRIWGLKMRIKGKSLLHLMTPQIWSYCMHTYNNIVRYYTYSHIVIYIVICSAMFIHIYHRLKIHKSQCPRTCPQPTHTAGPAASTARVWLAYGRGWLYLLGTE